MKRVYEYACVYCFETDVLLVLNQVPDTGRSFNFSNDATFQVAAAIACTTDGTPWYK
jgi:hypothetical protein